MEYNNVYVVIVTYNGQKWISKNIDSILRGYAKPKIIIIDNFSDDDTLRIVEQYFRDVILIKLDKNYGFGYANNIGISYALNEGADFIFLLNQDAYVADSTVYQLINFLDKNTQFDIVTPLHCSPDFERIDRKTLRGYLNPYGYDFLSDCCLGNQKEFYKIDGVNAAAWFLRGEVFKKVGGFDTMFFMYGEDDDLIGRFKYHKINFALAPYIKIVHLRETSFSNQKTSFLKKIYTRSERIRSDFMVTLKRPNISVKYSIMYIISRGIFEAFANFLILRDSIDFLASILASFRLVSEIIKIRRNSLMCTKIGPHFLNLDR